MKRKTISQSITPTLITLIRFILSPLFFVCFIVLYDVALAQSVRYLLLAAVWCVFGCIEISDVLDGMWARKNKLVTNSGKVLDPLADVFCRVTYFTCFVYADLLSVWIYIIIVYRELIIVTLRMLLALTNVAFAARKGGKIKTILFAAASIAALCTFTLQQLQLFDLLQRIAQRVTTGFFLIATALSITSAITYVVAMKREKLFSKMK